MSCGEKEVLLVARCWFDSSTPYGYCLMNTGGASPEILIDGFQLEM